MALSRPPYPLPNEIREKLRSRLEQRLRDPPQILSTRLLWKKIGILQGSDSKWIADLGNVSRRLFDMYESLLQTPGPRAESSLAALKVALDYLLDPFDLIPDTIVEYGSSLGRLSAQAGRDGLNLTIPRPAQLVVVQNWFEELKSRVPCSEAVKLSSFPRGTSPASCRTAR